MSVDRSFGYHDSREPFMIGGHDVPGRVFRAGVPDHILVRAHVLIPMFALPNVIHGELPILLGFFQPFQEPLLLLFSTKG